VKENTSGSGHNEGPAEHACTLEQHEKAFNQMRKRVFPVGRGKLTGVQGLRERMQANEIRRNCYIRRGCRQGEMGVGNNKVFAAKIRAISAAPDGRRWQNLKDLGDKRSEK